MTTNKKHFRAVNKTNPENVVEFDLEDIQTYEVDMIPWAVVRNNFHLDELLQYYRLEYLHNGEYYKYE